MKFTIVFLIFFILIVGCSTPLQRTSSPTEPSLINTQTIINGIEEPSIVEKLLDASVSTDLIPTEIITSTNSPSSTNTASVTKSLTPTSTSTYTQTPTSTSTPSSTPVPMPKINILLQTCDTGLDILRGLGEVTNAYITIQNIGAIEAKNVSIALLANDEDKPHPDQSYFIKYLPAGYEISLKLTVDTKNKVDTKLTIILNTEEGLSEKLEKDSCNNFLPDKERINSMGVLFKVVKIGTGN